MASVQELHYDFLLKIDKVASFSREDFSAAEIDWLLNEAQDVLVKTRYTGNNFSKTGFEVTQKRIDDLSSLVVKYPEQPYITPSVTSGVYYVPLSSLTYQYWYFIRGTVEVITASCTKEVSLRLIQHDDLNSALNDPFNNSSEDEWVLFNFGRKPLSSESCIFIYPGSTTIGRVKLEYIKRPAKISRGNYTYIDGLSYAPQTSELPAQVHSELVDIAVQIASGIIENPDYVNLKTQKVFTHE